jgi:hypothetical protein
LVRAASKGGDIPHATHVGRQGVDVVHAACGLKAILPPPEIQLQKLMGVGRAELRVFKVYSPDPISLACQSADQVVTDKASGSGDDNLTAMRHKGSLMRPIDSPA